MHESEITLLVFTVGALLLGALVKTATRNSKLPYTVVLLLIGIALASMDRAGWFGTGIMDGMFHQVGTIEPHLILFLFLPILIFESAYSMEPHLFFRIAPQIALLAVAGLIISMLLSALAVSWLLGWGIGAALLFGALISATDPIAVVALLKEKSSRKRLETLIEGESLLNDGTAIVFFSLFYGFALGSTAQIEPLGVIGEFIWVVSAGLLIGAGIGWLVLSLIGKLFNQPLTEITLSVAAAYLTFITAEELHVSGVVALVALALMFSTIGRMRVSPEVSHFLHQFWEMMAYLANTLIFLIVGIVIALHITLDSPYLWLVLGILYIVLTAIRAASVWTLMPLLTRVGIGIDHKKATVLVWGGLRGAVSLSLALSLAQDSNIPEPLRDQILFLTAGIVVLTIVINGSTMESLLRLLQLDKLPSAKEASVQKARQSLESKMKKYVKRLADNPFFSMVDTETFEKFIIKQDKNAPSLGTGTLMEEDEEVAFMRRLLEIERSDYWRQFEEGHIGRQAAFELSRTVEQALDNKPLIAPRRELENIFSIPAPPEWVQHVPMMGTSVEEWLFTRLSLGYDIARGFVEAQEEMRKHIARLCPNDKAEQNAQSMIDQNCTRAFAFTRHVGKHYPALVASLQSHSARRLLLNHKRSLIWKMQHNGVLEEAEAQHLIEEIENEMVRMRDNEDRESTL